MITVEELNNARTGDSFNSAVEYRVVGTDGDAEMTKPEAIQAVIDATPAEYDTLPRLNARVTQFFLTPTSTIARVTMEWGEVDSSGGASIAEPDTVGESVYEFAYQAEGYHGFYALATTSYGTNPPNFGNKMNVTPEGEHLGLEVPAGGTTNTWRYSAPQGYITSSYEALVESLMGAVNSVPYKGRPAGTMRFTQCQSSLVRGGALSITGGFEYRPNRASVTVGVISGVNIGGHDLWWSLDQKAVDLTCGRVVLTTRAVYVHQVHQLADLNVLGF